MKNNKAFYTYSELGELLHITRWKATAFVKAKQIPVDRIGNVFIVWLSELKKACPELSASLEEAEYEDMVGNNK